MTDPASITSLGASGLLAYLVVKEVLYFAKKTSSNGNGNSVCSDCQSLIRSFSQNIDRQTDCLQKVADTLMEVRVNQEHMARELHEHHLSR